MAADPTPMSEPTPKPRPVVAWFAREMERELKANDHKGGWRPPSCRERECVRFTPEMALRRLKQEVAELDRAVKRGEFPVRIVSEAADVANFALMIADLARIAAGEDVPSASAV